MNETANQVKAISIIELNGMYIPAIWSIPVNNETVYKISGYTDTFYELGTTNPVTVLIVSKAETPSIMDQFIEENRYTFSQLCLVTSIATAVLILSTTGVAVNIVVSIDNQPKKQKNTSPQSTEIHKN